MTILHFKRAVLKAATVLIPSYTAAYFTGEMIWVVPTLAASSFFAATIGIADETVVHRIDEDAAPDDALEQDSPINEG